MPYYREPNGDYLYVCPHAWEGTLHEGRATAIAGIPTSIQTTSIAEEYLATCTRVLRRRLPEEWRRVL